MENGNRPIGNRFDVRLYKEKLTDRGMFLIDRRFGCDQWVVYRSDVSNAIEWSFIKRHQADPRKPEIKVFIEDEYWGSISGMLFDNVPDLVQALRRTRGLTQVEL